MTKREVIPETPGKPYAEIFRQGRRTFCITIEDPTLDDDWYWEHSKPVYYASTWEGAERKAERKLRKYMKLRGYQTEPVVRITL